MKNFQNPPSPPSSSAQATADTYQGGIYQNMKIAILDPADFLGGAELFILDLLPSLSKELDVTVISNGNEEYMKLLPEYIRHVSLPLPRLRPFRPIAFFRAFRALKKYIQEEEFDLLHSNSVRAALFTSLLSKQLNIPWTHMQHDFTFPKRLVFFLKRAKKIFTCSGVVKEDLEKKGLQDVAPNPPFKGSFLEKKGTENPPSPPSSFTTATADTYRGGEHLIEVTYNGIDLEQMQQLQKPVIDRVTPIIALLGRIDTWKGQMEFLEIANMLGTKLPKAKYWIIGKSSNHDSKTIAYEQKLHKQAKQLQNVSFLGFLPKEEIFPKIDLLLHLSTKAEPFGRTVLEALAAGTPLLASQYGGAKEILNTPFLKQLLVDPKKPQEVGERILQLLQDDNFLQKYRTEAKKRAKNFDQKTLTQKMLRTWMSIFGKKDL